MLTTQGSNAHVVMEANSNDGVPSVADLPRQIWRRGRHWFAPLAHPLLTRATLAGDPSRPDQATVRFVSLLTHPFLAYLGDCRIGGRSVIPAAALLEVRVAGLFIFGVTFYGSKGYNSKGNT